MLTHEVLTLALALPISDRITLAQELWRSIQPECEANGDVTSVLELAKQRDHELETGLVRPVTHAEAMLAARNALR